MKLRRGNDGLHFFDRRSGINVLLNEIQFPRTEWAKAPRFVSFALTNLCDLRCPFCYAPKQSASLDAEKVIEWSHELDNNGCLGIGFGGGEPTLFPHFATLCRNVSESTGLSVSFTTHAHRFRPELRDSLNGAVHFIRVSMDGVGETYEHFRHRPFSTFLDQLSLVRDTSPFGINYVVNETTVCQLDEAAELVFSAGASELLLLPEYSANGLPASTRHRMSRWLKENSSRVRLSISELGVTDGMPIADPFVNEKGMMAYVHVSAFGKVSQTSYDQRGAIAINATNGILAAIAQYEGGETA